MLRYGKARGLRRVVRPGRGPTGAALVGRDASQTTFQAILGGLFVDAWQRESGASPASWVSSNGRTMLAVNTPTFIPDGANFRGANVIGTTAGGPDYMRGTGLTQMAATGDRPWMFLVGRMTAVGGVQTMCSLGNATTNEVSIADIAANIRFSTPLVSLVLGAADTSVHAFEAWYDGVNANGAIDGVTVSVANVGAVANNITAASVGIDTSNSNPGGMFISRYVVASPVPSPSQRAACLALAKQLDGF